MWRLSQEQPPSQPVSQPVSPSQQASQPLPPSQQSTQPLSLSQPGSAAASPCQARSPGGGSQPQADEPFAVRRLCFLGEGAAACSMVVGRGQQQVLCSVALQAHRRRLRRRRACRQMAASLPLC